jgi:hypothetical protein
MLPRRCKKCRCYVAPQLTRCPRCATRAAPLESPKLTREDKQSARAKRDAKVPVVHAKHIHWIPSAFSLRAHEAMIDELNRRLDKADTPRLRNTVRSELRTVRAVLARATVPSGKKPWTTETFHTKQTCVQVFVSPKKHRYVLADRDGPADLIIANRKNRKTMPFSRLQRFEHSRFARMKKLEKHDETVHKKRTKARKEKHATKRAIYKKKS